MGTIEQDAIRVNKYNEFKNHLDLLIELFSNGDTFVKNDNDLLTSIQQEIDSGQPTAWTKQDFNDMLAMRNAVLTPIMENASFAKQFTAYIL